MSINGNTVRILDDALFETLDTGQIDLAIQRIMPVDAQTATSPWIEVLARPRYRGRDIDVERFVVHAASLNRALELDLLIMRRSLMWLKRYPQIDLCSINVSGFSVSDPTFSESVIREVDLAGIPMSRLCFEITETVAVSDYDSASHFASSIQERGGRMAIDDFGAGSSNLRLCAPKVIDFIKIDGHFVESMTRNGDFRALVAGVVDLANRMDVKTVAERVETPEQYDCIKELGVHYLQGFLFGGSPERLPNGRYDVFSEESAHRLQIGA